MLQAVFTAGTCRFRLTLREGEWPRGWGRRLALFPRGVTLSGFFAHPGACCSRTKRDGGVRSENQRTDAVFITRPLPPQEVSGSRGSKIPAAEAFLYT